MLQHFTAWGTAAVLFLATAGGMRAQMGGGFYRLAQPAAGTAWWIDPAGTPWLLLGVNQLRVAPAGAPGLAPVTVDQRATAILSRVRALNFNTVGAGSDADLWNRGLPYVESLDLWSHLAATQQTPLVDVYAPDFTLQVRALVQMACAPRVGDHKLIGYLTDNGLDWDPGRDATAVLKFYLQLPLSAPGRARAQDFLRNRYHSDIGGLNRAWGSAARDFITLAPPERVNAAFAADAAGFAAAVLARYQQVAADAIHATDPNHPDLGAALAPPATLPPPGSDAALNWSIPDVVTVRMDPGVNPSAQLRLLETLSPRPLLVEWEGCGAVTTAAQQIFAVPAVVGYLWDPGAAWDQGGCAAQATQVWSAVNRVAAAQHRAPQDRLLP